MTPVVLFILAVVWTVYLFTWLRHRRERVGVNSISSFSRHLSVLERTTPVRPGGVSPLPGQSLQKPAGRLTPIYPAASYQAPRASMSLADARRRRRNVLFGLACAAVGSLVLIPFAGSLMVVLHLLIDGMLGAYVYLLVRNQRLATERREKVRYLPHVVGGEPQYLLQRSAN